MLFAQEDLGAGREGARANVDVVRLVAADARVNVGGNERIKIGVVELLVRKDGVPSGAPHSLRLRKVLTDSECGKLLKRRIPSLERTDVTVSEVVEQLEASAGGGAVEEGGEVGGEPREVDGDVASDLANLHVERVSEFV